MDAANAKVRRKDAIRGVELIVSLPKRSGINHRNCFEDFLNWVETFFAGIPTLHPIRYSSKIRLHFKIELAN
ncbi:hypothetical protein [Undibacterium sp. SXout20W]|uniref:hypothetical protein n=1 Tax=Undibacterium sp. SXout20W TaxID=3413051 RepID=UPI003BF00465